MTQQYRKVIDLDYAIARGVDQHNRMSLTIMTPVSVDENTVEPAQSVIIRGLDNIMKLRDLCIDMIENYKP